MVAQQTWQTVGKRCPVQQADCCGEACAWWCPPHPRREFGTCAVTLNVVQNGTITNTLKHRLSLPREEEEV